MCRKVLKTSELYPGGFQKWPAPPPCLLFKRELFIGNMFAHLKTGICTARLVLKALTAAPRKWLSNQETRIWIRRFSKAFGKLKSFLCVHG
jgi:hypothetical protein